MFAHFEKIHNEINEGESTEGETINTERFFSLFANALNNVDNWKNRETLQKIAMNMGRVVDESSSPKITRDERDLEGLFWSRALGLLLEPSSILGIYADSIESTPRDQQQRVVDYLLCTHKKMFNPEYREQQAENVTMFLAMVAEFQDIDGLTFGFQLLQ